MFKHGKYSLFAMCLGALLGCSTQGPLVRHNAKPTISLDSAKELIVSGQVQEIFQPHQGCVVLTLKDGKFLTFNQPYLDWILSYVKEHGLAGTIPISME